MKHTVVFRGLKDAVALEWDGGGSREGTSSLEEHIFNVWYFVIELVS